ncbi:MAG: 2Fe-2S iron-sulfur cluster-binding protein [Defluviitaleaceae bacterium]|nr:2Fe-2S iron-sulfur cluster-binding protein [Defluviitaleaceae bacterium]MCL2275095.1 2Fe-2S iron-sulfur cluster-binding protein [Defluviitaleaceae bacterium]
MNNRITVYFDGKAYEVPAELTIMTAMEYAGFRLVRGCGCRHGFCGACGAIYRIKGENKVHFALACQTQVQAEMHVATLPFFPLNRKKYELDALTPAPATMMHLFPEIFGCIGCKSCTKSCSRSLNVMQYIAYAKRNDLENCAHESFDCVACGICSARCPADISHALVGLLARRLKGKYLSAAASHNKARIEEIVKGEHDAPMTEVMGLSNEEIAQRYNAREIEA